MCFLHLESGQIYTAVRTTGRRKHVGTGIGGNPQWPWSYLLELTSDFGWKKAIRISYSHSTTLSKHNLRLKFLFEKWITSVRDSACTFPENVVLRRPPAVLLGLFHVPLLYTFSWFTLRRGPPAAPTAGARRRFMVSVNQALACSVL